MMGEEQYLNDSAKIPVLPKRKSAFGLIWIILTDGDGHHFSWSFLVLPC